MAAGSTIRRLFLLLEPCSGGDLWAALDRADPITPEQVPVCRTLYRAGGTVTVPGFAAGLSHR